MILTTTSAAALFLTMLVLSATPGPSDFAVVARSLSSGFRHGFLMVLGIVAADVLFILLAVLSLGVLAETLDGLFRWVRYACAAYLIWIAFQLWVARPQVTDLSEPVAASGGGSFMGGLMITLADPKAILFYMGLLPAFVDMPRITVADAVGIMLIATVVICGVKLSYAWLAHQARRLFADPRVRQRLDRLSAAVLAGLALYLIAGF